MKVVSAREMRSIDDSAIDRFGLSAAELMESAGSSMAEELASRIPGGGHVVVLAGRGNNGGDGIVAARRLAAFGWQVTLVPVMGTAFGGAALAAWRKLTPDVRVVLLNEAGPTEHLFAGADAIIDAMLGTGASGPPREPVAELIERVNQSTAFVLAADIPSGMDADSGVARPAVRAHCTVTVGLPKLGFFTGDGPEHTGSVVVVPALFPAELLAAPNVRTATLVPTDAKALLPARPRDGHKGTFGMVAIFAGSAPMPGAVSLAAQGALRSGCGLVRVVAPGAIRTLLAPQIPEALLPCPAALAGADTLGPLGVEEWTSLLENVDAAVVGPGMGVTREATDFLFQLLERHSGPLVLDADALNILAVQDDVRGELLEEHVLTPHPGELARLLKRPVPEIQKDRWGSARDAADRFGCVVVLKGAGTMVARPGGSVTHVPSGNTALSRGGSGDILSGLIGGLLAQGLAPANAAALGCWLHGLAADIACRDRSPRGVRLGEVLEALPLAFRETELPRPPGMGLVL